MSVHMRAIGTAAYLLTVALGLYAAAGLNVAISAASRSDPWVTSNPLYGHLDWYFYVNALVLAAGLGLYVYVTWNFVERPVEIRSIHTEHHGLSVLGAEVRERRHARRRDRTWARGTHGCRMNSDPVA